MADETGAPPNLGTGYPGHFMDMARAGHFAEPPPKSQLDKLADAITDSISSLQEAFTTKPTPWRNWGKAPTIRKEWFYLKGEQSLPLGPNRWEPFRLDVQNILSIGHDVLQGRGQGFVADVELDESGEELQVWLGSKLGTATEIVDFNPQLWAPKGEERPDSELLRAGKAKAMQGHFMSLTKERALVEEYYSTRWWTRAEKPTGLRVVLLVEETVESAVQVLSPELLSNPEYVVRVLNPAGLAVVGFRKNELEKRNVRDLKFKFEDIWHGKGDACFIVNGSEIHQDEELKRLTQRQKKKQAPVDVQVMYLTEEQAQLKKEGMGTIISGRFADLNREGYFWNVVRTPTQHAPACCVVS